MRARLIIIFSILLLTTCNSPQVQGWGGGLSYHRSTYGTPILASASGEVILSKYAEGNPWFGGYGNYIVVEHNNDTQTVYAHLSSNLVKRGWNIVQGQVIGYMGSTGRSTGPHLHFEIRGAVNPF